MERCGYCGKSGEFFAVGEDGLCDACRQSIMADVTEHVRVFDESMATFESDAALEVRLAAIDRAREQMEYFRDTYETRGMQVTQPMADKKIAELVKARNDALADGALHEAK